MKRTIQFDENGNETATTYGKELPVLTDDSSNKYLIEVDEIIPETVRYDFINKKLIPQKVENDELIDDLSKPEISIDSKNLKTRLSN